MFTGFVHPSSASSVPKTIWLAVLRWPRPLRRNGPDVRGDARTAGTAVQAQRDAVGTFGVGQNHSKSMNLQYD